ncbi:hypothetical protein EDD85DRAFT_810708 [Armillaria nabsnona]|nr:hypothetical protein EDD85DRAFT_810708 [Armillaria nabsnona]
MKTPRILAAPARSFCIIGVSSFYVHVAHACSCLRVPSFCHDMFTFFSVHCVCSLIIVYFIFMRFPSPEPFWGLLSTCGVLFRR